jgi:hypothetical protein
MSMGLTARYIKVIGDGSGSRGTRDYKNVLPEGLLPILYIERRGGAQDYGNKDAPSSPAVSSSPIMRFMF